MWIPDYNETDRRFRAAVAQGAVTNLLIRLTGDICLDPAKGMPEYAELIRSLYAHKGLPGTRYHPPAPDRDLTPEEQERVLALWSKILDAAKRGI